MVPSRIQVSSFPFPDMQCFINRPGVLRGKGKEHIFYFLVLVKCKFTNPHAIFGYVYDVDLLNKYS